MVKENPLYFVIVVLNWNGAADTLECLKSLSRIKYPHYSTIVVDNGSTDSSVYQIRSEYPEVFLLENTENLGYAEGNNCGIRKALELGAEMILLLNNDTVVCPNLLKELEAGALENKNAGVFGAKIYFYDEPTLLWYAGGGIDPKTGRCFHLRQGRCDLEKKDELLRETTYACGCALAIRSSILKEVGLLHAPFFLNWEEIDWCFRIVKAGYKCLFVPKAKVWHKVSASFVGGPRGPMWQYYYFRNKLFFHKRHSSFKQRFSLFFFWEIKELIKGSFYSKKDPNLCHLCRAGLKGVRDYFLGRFGNNYKIK